MPVEDTTDPFLQSPVSEGVCQKRTGKILAKLDVISRDVIETKTSFKAHRAWHNGIEEAEEKQRRRELQRTSKAGMYGRWIALALAVFLAFGGAVWVIATLAKPDMRVLAAEIARTNHYEYGVDIEPEEDP